jgi:TM2 domain-containing membrane protein YozV
MSQRDDTSDTDEQGEETEVADEADTDRSTDAGAGDGDPPTDESATPSEGETDASETEGGNGPEASGTTDEDPEKVEEVEGIEEDGSEETEEAKETGEIEDGENPEEADATDATDEPDPTTAGESGADDSPALEEESPGGVVESEVEESGAAEADTPPSAAPEKGLDEVYCQSCGEPIKAEAEVCPHCGVRQSGSSSEEKNSAVSFIASLIIPGAGQAYNGQIGRAVAVFFGAIVADTILFVLGTLLSVILIGVLFFLLIPVVHVVIAYDAYNQAEKINRGEVTV